MKQIKPLPKYVGYAARGLGVLLVQNSKEVVSSEQINPMGIVTIASGEINETQFWRDSTTCSSGTGNGDAKNIEIGLIL